MGGVGPIYPRNTHEEAIQHSTQGRKREDHTETQQYSRGGKIDLRDLLATASPLLSARKLQEFSQQLKAISSHFKSIEELMALLPADISPPGRGVLDILPRVVQWKEEFLRGHEQVNAALSTLPKEE